MSSINSPRFIEYPRFIKYPRFVVYEFSNFGVITHHVFAKNTRNDWRLSTAIKEIGHYKGDSEHYSTTTESGSHYLCEAYDDALRASEKVLADYFHCSDPISSVRKLSAGDFQEWMMGVEK